MPSKKTYDAVVIGSGPNGLSAAITLIHRFKSVVIIEGKSTIGGGLRSAQLTLPGFVHDICSTVHPLAISSPFFDKLPLEKYGIEWIQPDILVAHPFYDGTCLFLHRSIEYTCEAMGEDAMAYKRLISPFIKDYKRLLQDILKPIHIPEYPFLTFRFGIKAMKSARTIAYKLFKHEKTQALFAGLAGHAMIPLEKPFTSSFGIVLAVLAHTVGWPVIKGGSQKLADTLLNYFTDKGGEVLVNYPVASMKELPEASYYFFDVTPRQLLNIEGINLSKTYMEKLKKFRYGPGVQKVDWAIKKPIPWQSKMCRKAGTIHLGASFEEIERSIKYANNGIIPQLPYVIVAQPSLFDPTRAPEGNHTAWAYCHVPSSIEEDSSELVEDRIEQFAPGFKDIIMARHSMSPKKMEEYNPNYVGGDINGGIQDLAQLFSRPVFSFFPYRTSHKNIFICSSSTPPGGGVHGLCGYYAAKKLSPL